MTTYFPVWVKGPDGLVHRFWADQYVTKCGLDCDEWAVQLGGLPTCEECEKASD